jgi:hypothetical protein
MISRRLLLAALPVTAAFVAGAWLYERHVGVRLQAELAAARGQNAALRQLEGERDRLAAARRAAQDTVEAETSPVATEAESPDIAAAALGEWTPAAGWRNRGRFTVRDAISTLLAAAAAGDLGGLQASLEFSPEMRQRAQEAYAQLRPATRSQYRSPEELVAAVTMYRMPRTAAQLVWLNETDANHAIVGVMLANPDAPASGAGPAAEPPGRTAPPMAPDNGRVRLALLNLHRTGAEWRIVVPAKALDQVALEFGRPAGG